MTAVAEQHSADHAHCGCCGRDLPRGRGHELLATPGTYICRRCATWAAARETGRSLQRLTPWGRRAPAGSCGTAQAGDALRSIPILATTELDRTTAYYAPVGLHELERSPRYLVMTSGRAELHFSTGDGRPLPGQAFLHVDDARRLWSSLRDADQAGLGPVEEKPWGLTEFTLSDVDGNHLRVGSNT